MLRSAGRTFGSMLVIILLLFLSAGLRLLYRYFH
jgi:hypothetical protein